MEDDVLFLVGQVTEGHVGAHAHRAADVGHQRPHQAFPGGHRTLVDGEGVVRHKGALVHSHHGAGAAAGAAGALTVEGEFLCRKRPHAGPAHRADQRLFGRHGKAGLQPVAALRAGVAGQAGVHQPQAVQQLGAGAKGAADAGHGGPLVQGQRRRDVQHLIHGGLGRLCHAAAGVGGKGIQIPPGTLGIQHTQCKAGFARAGHTRHAHDLAQRHIHVHIFQVVHPCAADLDMIDHFSFSPVFGMVLL